MANIRLATTEPGKAEIFYSLQGEGFSMGRPSVFVRLAGCNLQCHWCDTPYTWYYQGVNAEHHGGQYYDKKSNIVTMSAEDIAGKIKEFPSKRSPCTNVIFTGGEPLLQQAGLRNICSILGDDYHIEIETNGTIALDNKFDPFVNQLNISPKLSHARNPGDKAINQDILTQYAGDRRVWLKFVVANAQDFDEIKAIVTQCNFAQNSIIIMPEGTDSETLQRKSGWIAEKCLEYGYRFSDRMHIHLYGDTRGT